jgi:TolA-binding protein
MKRMTFSTTTGASLVIGGLLLLSPLPLSAQDVPQDQQGHMGRYGTTGQQKDPAKKAEWRQHREQMEKMRTEMRQELEQQMTALRAHTKTMDGVTEEKQLLTEMKKHQQMTDALLGTMIEQREKMQAQMQQHHGHRHGGMGKGQPSEGSGSTPAAEQEHHHGQ